VGPPGKKHRRRWEDAGRGRKGGVKDDGAGIKILVTTMREGLYSKEE